MRGDKMVEKRERLRLPVSIHSQIAAHIVQEVSRISKRNDVSIFFRKINESRLVPAGSMLSMVTFFASRGEEIEVIIEGLKAEKAFDEFMQFFNSELGKEKEEKDTYELLRNTSIAYEKIFNSIGSGLVVTDENGVITIFNKLAEGITGISMDEAIGKKIQEVIPGIKIENVLKTGKEEMNKKIKVGNNVVFTNITPIYTGNKIEGSVIVFYDFPQIEYLENELKRNRKLDKAFDIIIGNSGKLRDALTIASKAAETDSTVLIRGESGTGKELVAQAIHYASRRRDKPFIRVNCAAIPVTLLESELFGHERGAFTGAVTQKIGKFELADGGTVFLDEIGEIPPEIQVKLLRVIQEKEFERVGGIKTIKVDVRIIAATNKDLEKAIKEGTFREDLYYRLNVIPIMLPPLRERRGDIPLLVEHFIEKLNKKLNKNIKGITKKAMQALIHYDWPGNIRELENIIERCITLSEGEYIDYEDLPQYIRNEDTIVSENNVIYLDEHSELLTMEEYEYKIIKAALDRYKSFNKAAKVLGLTHKTVASKARKFGLVDR
ncbi:PAS domain S-box-containing protein [Caldanaerobacter subterraneus subsp. tengcongensis MB4]|uniref:HTH-type transcriptional regulatory protein TyrR n=4 Tax=Caldanaerobacter subterraneus TaxID=911092 RepID=Q8R8J8_CALS4|nr:sigma 54-interacting transcriptional regulator [Caldanaerobacter subterraneus]AAM25176.1 AAA superfamily ATPases with N-terminal receiver domain [Caldanaerobacter subterraneus subsp. tengcongensis MB4]MCS3915228.1 PAS domain S-box-containing protein [Caldanaerobacter subterraneus subsp. tengcongensis MB4]TCO68192.1 PAS domain S-box-containing protein [Caldanaerobacter subterraneus]